MSNPVACRQSDRNFDSFHSALSRQVANSALMQHQPRLLLSLSLYRVVCHTVCHIIWTITNHASVKQTKRAERIRIRIRIRIRTRTWSPYSSYPLRKFASKSYFPTRVALTRRQSERRRERERARGRAKGSTDRAHHIWVLRAVRFFSAFLSCFFGVMWRRVFDGKRGRKRGKKER